MPCSATILPVSSQPSQTSRFGPAHGNAREADALVAARGGWVVDGAASFEHRVLRLLEEEGLARDAGARAREYVRSETGAAERNAALILEGL